MTGDIVTRLHCAYRERGSAMPPCGQCTFCLARFEIERLNNLLLRCYALAVGHGPNFEVFDTWEDAISAYENRSESNGYV